MKGGLLSCAEAIGGKLMGEEVLLDEHVEGGGHDGALGGYYISRGKEKGSHTISAHVAHHSSIRTTLDLPVSQEALSP
jgi:hypothetical protein